VAKTTRQLVDAVSADGVEQLTLLDIGGGLGGVQHELIDKGVLRTTHVDASRAYLQAAQEEAGDRNLLDKITFVAGDFVEVGEKIPQADIVTLDRVVCCYDDMQGLIRLSAKKARRTYGLVFPRDIWLFKLFLPIANFVLKLRGSSFRIFLHSTQQIEGIIKSTGLSLETKQKAGFWQILVFNRI